MRERTAGNMAKISRGRKRESGKRTRIRKIVPVCCSNLRQKAAPSSDHALFAAPLNRISVEPFLVLEKGPERQRYLPMLISFGARRECPGISQDVAPVLDKLCFAVERTFLRQRTSNRRHDATHIDSVTA
jgi:hypothetical protein